MIERCRRKDGRKPVVERKVYDRILVAAKDERLLARCDRRLLVPHFDEHVTVRVVPAVTVVVDARGDYSKIMFLFRQMG